MSMNVKYAFVTGDVAKVEELVTAGTIAEGTMCVTSEGDKLCVVRKDKTVSILSDEEGKIFESMEEAEAYLADPESGAKAGQTIVVKEDDSYKQYIVNPGAEGGLEVDEVGAAAEVSGPIWDEF